MKQDVLKATAWGLLVTLVLAGLIVVGSRNLAHFDAALIGYTFAVLFAAFGITYRYAMWQQRPPTAVLRRRGWQVLGNRQYLWPHLGNWAKRAASDIALNRFIWHRGRLRWLAHWLILWAVPSLWPLRFRWCSAGSPSHLSPEPSSVTASWSSDFRRSALQSTPSSPF